jgi:hypothetical protein
MRSAREFFDAVVEDSCAELFRAYGIHVTRRAATVPVAAPEVSTGGILTFVGDGLTGSILLVGSFDFVSGCRPAETRRQPLAICSAADWLIVRDWSMELVNQLFGRIRNKVYRHDVRLKAKAPSAVSGAALGVAIRLRTSNPYEFSADDGRGLRVWLDTSLGPSFSFIPSPAPVSVGTVKEGDIVLF